MRKLLALAQNFAGLKPGFLKVLLTYKQRRSAFINTLFVLVYQFYSFMLLQILIIIIMNIIIIIITVFVVIVIIVVISIAPLMLLTLIVLGFTLLLYIFV